LSEKLKLFTAGFVTDLKTVRNGNKVGRGRRLKYLIMDTRINRQTLRLERGTLSLGEFLEIVAHMCYNPKRHCATGRAPELSRPTLTARRRGAPPPPTQQIDSDSC
jgi:hypothetical protein